MAGYSQTPLIKNLGFNAGDSVCAIGEPAWYSRLLLEHDIYENKSVPATWVHIFLTSKEEIEDIITNIELQDIEKGIWISWPKKASGIVGDISEDTLRDVILPLGWVDTKVCAIDDIWSGLKFLRRKQ